MCREDQVAVQVAAGEQRLRRAAAHHHQARAGEADQDAEQLRPRCSLAQEQRGEQHDADRLEQHEDRGVRRGRSLEADDAERERRGVAADADQQDQAQIAAAERPAQAVTPEDRHEAQERHDRAQHDHGDLRQTAQRELHAGIGGAAQDVGEQEVEDAARPHRRT
ncbi:MAG: hypothetical protein U1E76_03935 [Planctomycetota bacterium]